MDAPEPTSDSTLSSSALLAHAVIVPLLPVRWGDARPLAVGSRVPRIKRRGVD